MMTTGIRSWFERKTVRAATAAALALVAGSCAFENGPARHLEVSLLSPPEATVTTDLGWEVTLESARLFVHEVTFLTGEEDASAASGHTHASLTLALETEPGAIGTLRLAHSHGTTETSAAATKVGELLVDRAVDLLAAPVDLGRALFACGAEAVEARILVAPPEGSEPSMHGGGLYLAGTAVPPGGGDPVSFEAALAVGAEASIAGLDIDADDEPALEIHVPRSGWFDGIDFAALPGGLLEDGTEPAEALEELLLHEGFHVHLAGE
ncbi:MAG: hypothetical protein JXB32_00290 [Deltaproteobacteria bacterium]|nr:hypothetical protein [Deltaproteobacteria bacterium]